MVLPMVLEHGMAKDAHVPDSRVGFYLAIARDLQVAEDELEKCIWDEQ